jgi:putative PIN family toxin of toxin-antitoxin system
VKLVLDTDVVVAAFRSPAGASAALLNSIDAGKAEIALTVALVLEYESVLARPEHLAAANATVEEAQLVVDALVNLGRPVRTDYRWRPRTRDPSDEMVLEAAINAGAEAIVTFNRRDFGNAPADFGIACLLPAEVLERLR